MWYGAGMKKIIFPNSESTIDFSDIDPNNPIFVKDEGGRFVGMVVHEGGGWVVRTGPNLLPGYIYDTLEKCLNGSKHIYEFYIET